MLFWIFVIIAILALIINSLSNCAKGEYRKLEAQIDELDDARRYLPYDAPNYGEVLREWRKAYNKLQVYKNTKKSVNNWMIGIFVTCLVIISIMSIALIGKHCSAGGVRVALESEH